MIGCATLGTKERQRGADSYVGYVRALDGNTRCVFKPA